MLLVHGLVVAGPGEQVEFARGGEQERVEIDASGPAGGRIDILQLVVHSLLSAGGGALVQFGTADSADPFRHIFLRPAQQREGGEEGVEESAAVADAADSVQIRSGNPADILLGGAAVFADRGAG